MKWVLITTFKNPIKVKMPWNINSGAFLLGIGIL
jgi:hypothetical protein